MSLVIVEKKPKVTSIDSADKVQAKTNRSTGPKTEAGKQTASRNSETHGCTSSIPVVNGRVPPEVEARIVLPDENPQEWEGLKLNWHTQYQPQTETHHTLVMNAVVAEWMMRRTLRRYNEIEVSLFKHQSDPTQWTAEQHAALELYLRYRVRAERAFYRARQALELLRREAKADAGKAKVHDAVPQPPAHRPPSAALPVEPSLLALSIEGAVPLVQRKPGSIIQCITVQAIDGRTSTLFQPRNEVLQRIISNAPEPKPVVKRALYFLDGIPAEYCWISGYDSHDGRPHYVITRTSHEALLDLEHEEQDGSGHVLPVRSLEN